MDKQILENHINGLKRARDACRSQLDTGAMKELDGAIALLEEFCISDPTTIELEDLAAAKNGFVQYQPMQGAQGRILLDGQRAIITVDSGIRDPKRRRFVLAHELGHLILHVNAQQQHFNCDIDAFLDWLDAPASLRRFHRIWNGVETGPLPAPDLPAWGDAIRAARERLLRQDDLVTQLLRFYAEKS